MKTLVVDVDLSRRALNSVPRLDQFQSLQSLNISHNYVHILNNLPSTLKSLDASHNLIVDLSPIWCLHQLETGNFSHNNISKIAITGEYANRNLRQQGPGLTKLVDLDLSYNKIESLKDLKNLPALMSISLKSNNIFSLDEFKYFSINNVSPKTMTIIDNPISEDSQHISKISSLVPSVDHIDGIHVTRQRDWTVAVGAGQSSRFPQQVVGIRASDVRDVRRWIIIQGSASPLLNQDDPSEILYCSDASEPGEAKESRNQLSTDPEDFAFEPEPKEFPILTLHASVQTELHRSDISVDSKDTEQGHDARENLLSPPQSQRSDLEPGQNGFAAHKVSVFPGHLIHSQRSRECFGNEDVGKRVSDEDILVSLLFQQAIINEANIDTRVHQIQEQFCSATKIKESRFSFSRAGTDSGLFCMDFTLSASTYIDEPTAQAVFSDACNQICLENSEWSQGSVSRWLIALVQKHHTNHKFAVNPLVSKFLARSNEKKSSVKILEFSHKTVRIGQLCSAFKSWKINLQHRRVHQTQEKRIGRMNAKQCLAECFQVWNHVVFKHQIFHEVNCQKWLCFGKSKQNLSHQSRERRCFIVWSCWVCRQKKFRIVKKKILDRTRIDSLSLSFTGLCEHASACAHERIQDANMKYVQQCVKVHALSAVRSLNAATTCMQLFDSRRNLKQLKSICRAFLQWESQVSLSKLRFDTIDVFGQYWERIRTHKIKQDYIRCVFCHSFIFFVSNQSDAVAAGNGDQENLSNVSMMGLDMRSM